jgi:thiamine thiazole synthase
MSELHETQVSRTIISAYHEKLTDRIVSDVVIVGAGPTGLTAAFYLTQAGWKVTLLEKRLAIGGGIWGGGMGMNEVVVQDEALPILEQMNVRHRSRGEGLHTVDAVELACGLCLRAIQAGAVLLNLTTVEDVCVHERRLTGVVANRSLIVEALPVDPLSFAAKAVIDATGHEAVVVRTLLKRGLLRDSPDVGVTGEGPMDALGGERFVVERVAEIFPGLWVSGMCVSAALGGPRMGPIFGGMLLSGKRVADLINKSLKES